METMLVRHLYRSATERVCAGVCGGLGEYWAIDPVVLRLLWTFITVFTGFAPGIIVYIIPVKPLELPAAHQ